MNWVYDKTYSCWVIKAQQGTKLAPHKIYYNKAGNFYFRQNSDGTRTKVSVNDDGSFEWTKPNGIRVRTRQRFKIDPKYKNAQVVNSYIQNVAPVMENPTSEGFNGRTWGKYIDKSKNGAIHTNIYYGIESNSDMGQQIDYTKRYTSSQLEPILREDLQRKQEQIDQDLRTMGGGKYSTLADTMSLGNRLILLDIAHNVSPRGKGKNMPRQWPNLVRAMSDGNSREIYEQSNSGSVRRQDMRSDLIFQHNVNPNTIRNR